MRRVCVVITARPSYARILTALEALRADVGCTLLVVGGASALLSRFGRVVDQIVSDGFAVADQCATVLEGSTVLTSAKETGLLTSELASVFHRLAPDLVVTIADRHETIATAIAASYQHIPLVHVQGGEVTGSIDDKVRDAVSMLADQHLVAHDAAASRLILMGVDPACVHVTGCPSIDLALRAQADPLPILGGVGPLRHPLDGEYLIVSQHPVTPEHFDAYGQIATTLTACRRIGLPLVVFWPGQDAGQEDGAKAIRVFREAHPEIQIVRHLAPRAFLRLLGGAAAIIGNSSAGIREASALGVPAVNIGARQQGRARAANVIDVDHDPGAIQHAIRRALAMGRCAPSTLYGDGLAGPRIAAALLTVPLQTRTEVAA